jgi:uncharacterized protein (TIGR03435 family)
MKLILGGLLFLATSLPAQTVEVASIHPHKSTGDDPSNRQVIGGRFVATGTSVQTLIRTSFGIDPKAILNAPAWTESETFDIQATIADHSEIKTPEQYSHLVLSLLEQHFGLKYHREQREAPTYWLVLDKAGKPGPGLIATKPGTPMNISMNGGNRIDMRATNISMQDFAKAIQKRAGRSTEDHTGLADRYDLHLQWATDLSPESDDPTLSAVLKEQLGLKLQPAKGQTEVIVIDAINHPTTD